MIGRGEYTGIILDQMEAVLAPSGFRPRARWFSADRGDTVLLVQLQRDRYSTLDWLGATVNIGVHVRLLAARGQLMSAKIGRYPCHWYERIGFVTPYDTDQWWEVEDPLAALEAGAEIAALLKVHCLPLLDSLSSVERLRAYWLDGGDAGITPVMRDRYLAALDGDCPETA